MAQLALTFAQNAATSAAQGFATRAISSLLSKRRDIGPSLEELHILSSTDGTPMPIVYGRVRLGGQVIWTDQPIEHQINRRAGGKGGPRIRERKYTLSLAIGLCEGEIDGIGRIWADGALFDSALINMRVYMGSETQAPDPLVEIKEGNGATPAFRGLAYVVLEDLPLETFGNRVPQFSFEVFRTPKSSGDVNLEDKIRGVSLIPGSGEFTYATEPVITDLGPGQSRSENVHARRGRADVDVALDSLETHLPNCDTVSLVISWFGDDLRCGEITFQPKAEDDNKLTLPLEWDVQGLNRAQVALVSKDDKQRPVFGGTPADEAVLQSIASLKQRNKSVVFYPFILMDIPAGNALPDPYGNVEQSPFPWRGRITCFPAPGQSGTVDKTNAVLGQIDACFGTASASDFSINGQSVAYTGPNEWSYRRFILHYASLCAIAGGVDAFIIGSELRALTSLRDGAGNFPAVDQLKLLAAEVRSILPATKISYAADWSEYFGYQPQDGSNDVYFNLDPLWADQNIDFIGIDWYVPLSDWRDGTQHLDASVSRSIYDKAYLSVNIEGGEGFDWFYASQNDRKNQNRTPITDGGYAKDWVFRYKDLRSWWSNFHYNRPGGVEDSAATAWVPQSKPIWFTEMGCPAVDKGANQPNVFVDAKSSESALPYFSRGQRDDFMQRAYLDAITSYWDPTQGNNPQSNVYNGPMVQNNKILAWTWDARPFPHFPALQDVWSDGVNWEKGHWLNGRMGLSSLAALIYDVCVKSGISPIDVSRVEGMVPGYVVNGPTTARASLERLLAVYGVEVVETFSGLKFQNISQDEALVTITPDQFIADQLAQKPSLNLPDKDALPIEVQIQFAHEATDYQPASASAHGVETQKQRTINFSLPLVSDDVFMRSAARTVLSQAIATENTASLTLPPSFLSLEPGDTVRVNALDANKIWRVDKIDDALHRGLSLKLQADTSTLGVAGAVPGVGNVPIANPGPPVVAAMDLPLLPAEQERSGPRVVAFARPWTSDVLILDPSTGAERARLSSPAVMGEVVSVTGQSVVLGRWDNGTVITVRLYAGVLSSLPGQSVLAGENVLAIEHVGGAWEVLQFQNAVLTAENTYDLSSLLRGVSGSDDALATAIAPNARCVLMNGASQVLPMQDFETGISVSFPVRAEASPPDGLAEASLVMTYNDRVSKLPSPVHIRSTLIVSGVALTWVRRTRTGGDFWGSGEVPLLAVPEQYRVRLYGGGSILSETILAAPNFTITDAEIDLLFPNGRPLTLDVGIAQISQISGVGGEGREILYI
ncbi:MAG: hypothetical protein COA84_03960 [Robiginitomaculum sp.]|nr:MAG: hypothetical protein COA84_03960 [Robiginitomaculum sp.]